MSHSYSLPQLFFVTTVALSLCLHAPKAEAAANISKTITVNPNGSGDYKTIQDAVNSIPDNNSQWIKIHVVAGIYREKVTIGNTKTNIFLAGDGADKTSIEWDDHNNNTGVASSPTFASNADNFVAAGIAFKNTYGGKGIKMWQAVAAQIAGDKSAFYGCEFSGLQDTLYDVSGRHYYKGCKMEGIVDFIYGKGTSMFEGCQLSTVDGNVILPGIITANGREDPNDASGFVFKECTVVGTHPVNLGRAWKPYARVIFYKTNMSDIITPVGWVAWRAQGRENDTTFVESKCAGPGSDVSKRPSWEKKLSDDQLKPFIDISFIDKEGWIDAQPSTS